MKISKASLFVFQSLNQSIEQLQTEKQNITESIEQLQTEKQNFATEALAIWDKALSIDPNNTNILTNIGLYLVKLGKYGEAISYLHKSLSIDPSNPKALYNKGKALDLLGRHDEAQLYIEKAHELDPNVGGDGGGVPIISKPNRLCLKQIIT